jgi:hypothetical protein
VVRVRSSSARRQARAVAAPSMHLPAARSTRCARVPSCALGGGRRTCGRERVGAHVAPPVEVEHGRRPVRRLHTRRVRARARTCVRTCVHACASARVYLPLSLAPPSASPLALAPARARARSPPVRPLRSLPLWMCVRTRVRARPSVRARVLPHQARPGGEPVRHAVAAAGLLVVQVRVDHHSDVVQKQALPAPPAPTARIGASSHRSRTPTRAAALVRERRRACPPPLSCQTRTTSPPRSLLFRRATSAPPLPFLPRNVSARAAGVRAADARARVGWRTHRRVSLSDDCSSSNRGAAAASELPERRKRSRAKAQADDTRRYR